MTALLHQPRRPAVRRVSRRQRWEQMPGRASRQAHGFHEGARRALDNQFDGLFVFSAVKRVFDRVIVRGYGIVGQRNSADTIDPDDWRGGNFRKSFDRRKNPSTHSTILRCFAPVGSYDYKIGITTKVPPVTGNNIAQSHILRGEYCHCYIGIPPRTRERESVLSFRLWRSGAFA